MSQRFMTVAIASGTWGADAEVTGLDDPDRLLHSVRRPDSRAEGRRGDSDAVRSSPAVSRHLAHWIAWIGVRRSLWCLVLLRERFGGPTDSDPVGRRCLGVYGQTLGDTEMAASHPLAESVRLNPFPSCC